MKDNKIIENYKFALVDEYYIYLDIIKHLNKSMKELAKDMGITLPKESKFTYPEFCTKFLKMLRNCDFQDEKTYDEEALQLIFENMIMDKIIENIKPKDN